MSLSTYNFPTPVFFGNQSRNLLKSHFSELGLRAPLFVTDKGLVNHPLLQKLIDDLSGQGFRCETFSNLSPNPVTMNVSEGKDAFLKHDADSIIAFGGGAAMDVAKAIALMAYHPGNFIDYENADDDAFSEPVPHLVCLPTTAGTGSEVGRSTVISDDETHEKKIIGHNCLFPKAVYADPELTLSLPAHLTAYTGMDALCHLIESFLVDEDHPMCDGIALEGVHLVAGHLTLCVENAQESDLSIEERMFHRGKMMQAAMMGAVAFQKGLGVVHACAHALSTVSGMHHGLANAIMLPFALKVNAEYCASKFARLGKAAGLLDSSPEAFLDYLSRLKAFLKVPAQLSDAGVEESALDELVAVAAKDGCLATNPVEVSPEKLREIFKEAL